MARYKDIPADEPPQEPSGTALAMMRRLYDATDGRPTRWCSIDLIVDMPGHVDALQIAVDQQWIETLSGHSVRLSDEGRRLVMRCSALG